MSKPGPKPRPSQEVLSATVGVSVTCDTRDEWHAAAAKRGLRLADMVRLAVVEFLAKPRGR